MLGVEFGDEDSQNILQLAESADSSKEELVLLKTKLLDELGCYNKAQVKSVRNKTTDQICTREKSLQSLSTLKIMKDYLFHSLIN